ncbi:anaerobic C4-dicarboxylate transporter [Campylobacter ureolyticus]|uniref:anaerobic C4-dicarboxylate transporter n=1 Tax=Campylobacter ureolyticus TaxID=827 RepID=UPI0022B37780|nr:anaerobic C4-dicarboxylate transporter [Campylobacter ureolyticus]MCZ6156707.1 anaerobic C4-dicarboxylate transporter [Campylobacter ureolyticus]
MLSVELLVVLGAIFFGARLGSIGIGFAGGAGVLILTLFLGIAAKAQNIPIDVILIMMSVISCIAAMQVAGGLDYLVHIAEKILRKHPERITFLAPIVTYILTFFAGTGHTAFSTLPVIAEVAKEQGIRPSRPLSIAVVASQVAITASPISAAVVFTSGLLEPLGVGYLQLLACMVPSTFLACMIGAFVANFIGKELDDDPIYQERLKQGLVKIKGVGNYIPKPSAKRSVIIFIFAILVVAFYATAISDKVGLIPADKITVPRNEAIVLFMLTAATIIIATTKSNAAEVLNTSTFKSGMSAAVCVLGVAWLGTTFVNHHVDGLKLLVGDLLSDYPWTLAVMLFFASMLLYSQAATAKVLFPVALAIGVSPSALVACFGAVSVMFVLPTYPTLIAAVEMDDTGSTRIGKYVFNHPFIVPGVTTIVTSVIFGFVFTSIIL